VTISNGDSLGITNALKYKHVFIVVCKTYF